MELEFDKVLKLPVLNIGDIKNDVSSCKIQSISHHDRFVYSIEIEYVDKRKENYKIGYIGRMISYSVFHKEGMTTASWIFPIDPFISKEEMIITVGIVPYSESSTGEIKPAKLELQKEDIQRKILGKMVTVESFPLLTFRPQLAAVGML